MTDKKTEPKGISPAEMAEKTKAAAAKDAKTVAKTSVTASVATPTEVQAKKDETFAEKLAKSGYMYHQRQSALGNEWIGEIEEECNRTERCKHLPIAEINPRAGMEVRKGGVAFALPMDTPRDSTPAFWASVTDGKGKLLFA